MSTGTHRPELLGDGEGGLVVTVVEPSGPGTGQIKHRAYRFNADLEQQGESFVVTQTTDEYGEPADHRTAIVDGELVVVYQSLIRDSSGGGGGPAENNATEQSLLLARFSLDGEELFRGPIVAHQTDFDLDNFPDHCLLPLGGGKLLVSTGTAGVNDIVFREVHISDATFVIEERHGITGSGLSQSIGNSLLADGDGIFLLSYGNEGIFRDELDADYSLLGEQDIWPSDGLDVVFPTGNLMIGGTLVVGYIGRDPEGGWDLESNPYSPRLMLVDSTGEQFYDEYVSTDDGQGHLHPTATVLGDTLYYGWSTRLTESTRVMPQVRLEMYRIED